MSEAPTSLAGPDGAVAVAPLLDLLEPRRIHVVGAGGAGMSAIAAVLSWMGHRVSGSDLKDSSSLERLRALGIEVHVGHRPENVGDVDVVTVSTAIPSTNAEVVDAVGRRIPVLSRAGMLRAIAAVKRTVAVAGTHGKTTTSSMLSLILMEAGTRPSFIIGGDVNEIGSGAVWDTGDLFVVEADESDGTFLTLPRVAAIVTNVEPDHLEHWGGFANLDAAFARFVAETPGRWCAVRTTPARPIWPPVTARSPTAPIPGRRTAWSRSSAAVTAPRSTW